ncbi:uncharacterized protein si:ch211-106e7.2 [Labrus mixtus]|uniref:uncharacterized protein si:ch211-106e7.2 n=1 Tax=Labrus mixtus TaxID=508554 RepID=UPI0029C09956|nr:uncharacterized protein si:ch211-106e7.2 [Labrus mixtus]
MDSRTWMYQQVEPALQSSQAATQCLQETMRNQQTVNRSHQYQTSNTGVPVPQDSQRWRTNWQALTAHNQAASSWQTSGGRTYQNYRRESYGNYQSRAPQVMVNNRSQGSTQLVSHQNSPQNSFNMVTANPPSGLIQNVFFQNANGGSAQTRTITSLTNEQVTNVSLPSAAHNLNHSQIRVQNGCPRATPPPNYHSVVSQYSRNQSVTSSPSVQQKFEKFGQLILPKTQLSDGRQFDNSWLSRTSQPPLNPSSETMEHMRIARIEEDLRKSVPVGLDGCLSDHTGSQYSVKHFLRQILSNRDVQPAEDTTSYVHQSSPLTSARSLPETPRTSMVTVTHQSMDSAPPHSSVFYGRAAGDGVRNGGMAANYFPPTNNQVSNVNQGGAVRAVSQVINGPAQSSSGRMRAVAVVPPLSQESQHDATKHCSSHTSSEEAECATMDESLCVRQTNINNNKTQDFTESHLNSENPNDSTGHQGMPQKQSCIDDTGSVLVTNVQPASAPIPATPEAPASFVALSSIQTVECTLNTLKKLIEHFDRAQSAQCVNSPLLNLGHQVLEMFWGGNHKMCLTHVRDLHRPIIDMAKEYCKEHLKKNTVIASRVKKAHFKSLEDHHTLQHDDVYTEPPYKSTWLNLNEQVDDIDKMFGLPLPLRRRAHTLDSDVQLDEDEILNLSAQLRNDSPYKELSQTEPELADSGVEFSAFTDEEASTPTDDASNPLHSLEYEVLPLEEAIAVFERAGRDANILPEIVEDRSVEAKALNATSSDSTEEKMMSVGPIEEVCCIQRLMLIINGSNMNKRVCQCQKEQSPNKNTYRTFGEEVVTELKKDEVFVIKLGGNSDKTPSQAVESMDTQMIETTDTSWDEETNILTEMLNSSRPSITLLSGNENDSLSGGENTEQTEDPEKDSERAREKVREFRAVNGVQSDNQVDGEQDLSRCAVVRRDGDMNLSSCKSGVQMLDLQESCGDVGESSLKTIKQPFVAAQRTSLNLSRKHETLVRKRKRRHDRDRLFHPLKKSKKRFIAVDSHAALQDVSKHRTSLADGEPFVSRYRTVKLTLFGSPKDDELDFSTNKAPKFLSVLLSPEKVSAPVPAGGPSLKLRIHEKWRESIPQSQVTFKSKSTTQRCNYSSSSGGKLKTSEPVVSAKRSDKRLKRLLSKVTKQRKETLKRDVASHKKPAENRKYSVKPLHDQNILVFSVLPKTFNFQDGAQETENPEEPAPNETELVEEQNPNQTVMKKKVSWKNPNSDKKYFPLRQDSSSIFLDFQKKYIKKTQQE